MKCDETICWGTRRLNFRTRFVADGEGKRRKTRTKSGKREERLSFAGDGLLVGLEARVGRRP